MISIVVPLYNYARYIEENIQSIVRQTYPDWEIIIVDDHSKDDPLKVIKPYLSDKIKYICLEKNVGYGAAKNVGIRASNGEYIVVLDADDMLTDNSLAARIKAIRNSRHNWVHAKALEFTDRKPYRFRFKKRKSIRRLRHILKHKDYGELWNSMHAQTVMIHRSIYEKVGLYEPSLRSMGDKEMWARIINNIGIPAYLDKFVALYRLHSGQMHRSKEKKQRLKQYYKILGRLMAERRTGNFESTEKCVFPSP